MCSLENRTAVTISNQEIFIFSFQLFDRCVINLCTFSFWFQKILVSLDFLVFWNLWSKKPKIQMKLLILGFLWSLFFFNQCFFDIQRFGNMGIFIFVMIPRNSTHVFMRPLWQRMLFSCVFNHRNRRWAKLYRCKFRCYLPTTRLILLLILEWKLVT